MDSPNMKASSRLGRLIHSIRFRITLWFVAILAAILGAFSIFIYFRQTEVLRAETSSRLIAQQSQLGNYYRAVFHSVNEKESEPGDWGRDPGTIFPCSSPPMHLQFLTQRDKPSSKAQIFQQTSYLAYTRPGVAPKTRLRLSWFLLRRMIHPKEELRRITIS